VRPDVREGVVMQGEPVQGVQVAKVKGDGTTELVVAHEEVAEAE
jgi:hypothetical protein